jgi:hypothetical protein
MITLTVIMITDITTVTVMSFADIVDLGNDIVSLAKVLSLAANVGGPENIEGPASAMSLASVTPAVVNLVSVYKVSYSVMPDLRSLSRTGYTGIQTWSRRSREPS